MNSYKALIRDIIDSYRDEDGRISNYYECNKEILNLLDNQYVNYVHDCNSVDCGPGYECTYFWYAWHDAGDMNYIDFLGECY